MPSGSKPASTRKARNLARDPRCTLSVAAQEFDLVVDGEARVVKDPATVAIMAARWAAEGWPARVDDSGVALTAGTAHRRRDRRPGSCTGSRRTR